MFHVGTCGSLAVIYPAGKVGLLVASSGRYRRAHWKSVVVKYPVLD